MKWICVICCSRNLNLKINKMKITEFKKGDVVVRTQPTPKIGDRSYIGEKLTLVSIANGLAYFEREENCLTSKLSGNTNLIIPLDEFMDDWQLWVDPYSDNTKSEPLKYNIKEEIQKAVDSEDYELLAELKTMLDSAFE